MYSPLHYQMALAFLPGVGSVQGRKLIKAFGNAESVFREKRNNLLKLPGIGEFVVRALKDKDTWSRVEHELKFVEKYGIRPIFFLDEHYPRRLRHCEDGPLMLFYKGSDVLNPERALGVVGTRKPTAYGKDVCEAIIHEMTGDNVVIVSGLAYGIDTISHQAALGAGLPTVGVLGHGLDTIYPYPNRAIAEKMLDSGGLITEFTSRTRLNKDLFPRRNRIIAGMSDAILVVESAGKGGALITADIANSYNRDVFAVPGRVNDPRSKGCNELIMNNKAALVQSARDIKFMLGWDGEPQKRVIQAKLFPDMTEEEKKLYDFLAEKREAEIDELCHETGMTHGRAAACLLKLEFEGMVKCLPGKKYRLCQFDRS